MLRAGWSEVTEQGARTLTAQFLHETSGGASCYNWNLGNVKATNTNVPLPPSATEETVIQELGQWL